MTVKKIRKRKPRKSGNATTMADVAAMAGVSTMTVSRVINLESNVSEATRSRVESAIESLGYAPNESARSLAGARHVQILMLYHEPSAYIAGFLFGGLDKLREKNAHFTLERCADLRRAEEVLKRAIAGGIDGVLMPSPFADSGRLLELLKSAGIPVVVVTSNVVSERVSAVSINDLDAAYQLTRYLLDRGHRNIGFITGNPVHMASGRRLEGFKEAMNEAGARIPRGFIVQGDFTYRSGFHAAQQLLDLPNRPSAIFASNDEMAIATISVAHSRGLELPRELSVVGFDDVPMARSVWPELTTIRQPVAEMSSVAAELLIEKIRAREAGSEIQPRHRVLDFLLVERNSVATL